MRLRAFRSTWQPIRSRIQEINWCLNEWTWPLLRGRIKVMSTIALHSTLNIPETVRDRGYGSKGPRTNWKWYMGYQMVTWLMTSHDLERSNSWPPICLKHNISKTAGFKDSVPKDYQLEMAYWFSNGHVTNDVTWPQSCCEAVQSAISLALWTIPATAWLLVYDVDVLASWSMVSPGIISFTYLTHMPEF